jgi:heme oxygenase
MPFLRSLERGELSRPGYLSWLQSLLILHQVVERALGDARHLSGLDRPEYQRSETLRRDIRTMRGHVPVRSSDTLDEFDSRVRTWVRPPGAFLVGTVYVLERERQNPSRRAGLVSRALDVKVGKLAGLDYFLDDSDRTARRFRKLRELLDSRIRSEARAREVLQGAVSTMQFLARMYEDLGK